MKRVAKIGNIKRGLSAHHRIAIRVGIDQPFCSMVFVEEAHNLFTIGEEHNRGNEHAKTINRLHKDK